MGAGFHREGAKGAKLLFAALGRAACGFALVSFMAVALASPLRAGDPIDRDALKLAQRWAASRWEAVSANAVPLDRIDRDAWHTLPLGPNFGDSQPEPVSAEAMRRNHYKPETSRRHLGLDWAWSVVGMVTDDLLRANPDREADILLYLNTVLIPEIYAHHDAYVCGWTRVYYGAGSVWTMRFAQSLNLYQTDPWAEAAFFVAPTRDYLRRQHLNFTLRALRFLDRYARFAPNGDHWRDLAASRAHVPCASAVEEGSGPGGSL